MAIFTDAEEEEEHAEDIRNEIEEEGLFLRIWGNDTRPLMPPRESSRDDGPKKCECKAIAGGLCVASGGE